MAEAKGDDMHGTSAGVSGTYQISNSKKGNSTWLSCWSTRFTVAILGCLAMMIMQAHQLAMTSSLGCMLNSSLLVHQVVSLDSKGPSFVCNSNDDESLVTAESRNSTAARKETIWHRHLINGEFIWEPLHQHLILGTFSWGYLFSLGTAGLLAGRSSGHKVLGYFHLSLSFCSLLTPLAAKFMHVYSVMVLQFITGFCAGVTYPCLLVLWSRWAPPNEHARLLAVTYCGIPLGSVLVTSTVQVTCYYSSGGAGWSALFYILGLFGILWFCLWMFLVSSCPEKSKRTSDTEKMYILKHVPCQELGEQQVSLGWQKLFTSCEVWSMVASHISNEWSLYVLTFAMPVYLRDVFQMDIYRFLSGYFSTTPHAAFFIILLLSSLFADCIIGSKRNRLSVVRKMFSTFGAFAVGTGFLLATAIDCRNWVSLVVILTATTGCLAMQYSSTMITPVDISPKYSGILIAFSLTISQAMKITGTYASNYFTIQGDEFEWSIVFYISAALAYISGIAFLLFGFSQSEPWKNKNGRNAPPSEEALTHYIEHNSSQSLDEMQSLRQLHSDSSGFARTRTRPRPRSSVRYVDSAANESIQVFAADQQVCAPIQGYDNFQAQNYDEFLRNYDEPLRKSTRKPPMVSIV